MTASQQFMTRGEIYKFFTERRIPEPTAGRILPYLLTLITPSGTYLFSKVYFEAFIVFLNGQSPTIRLAWDFQQTGQAQTLIISEKIALQAKLTALAKKKIGLTVEVVAELFLISAVRVKRWARQDDITLLPGEQERYDPDTLLKQFEWSP